MFIPSVYCVCLSLQDWIDLVIAVSPPKEYEDEVYVHRLLFILSQAPTNDSYMRSNAFKFAQ